ncbi:MAG: alkaline phosphatase family protein [Bdellovibrionia bacterium]
MILFFDQMRYDYIDRFDMKNLKRLRAMSMNYPNAVVGHIASATVVSHLVVPTGLLPKDLPWGDNIMWDKKGIIGEKDKVLITPALSKEDMLKGLATISPDNYLPAILLKRLKKPTFTAGEKHYPVIDMGGPAAKSMIYIDDAPNETCVPGGVGIPQYISANDRFKLNCKEIKKSPDGMAVTGNEYYPGTDKKHLGGDIWVADIGLEYMKNEDWGGIFLTFGAIDKFGHMAGEPGKVTPLAKTLPISHEEIIKIADEQFGRIFDDLKKRKLLERTMIVITADHGVQSATTLPVEERRKIIAGINRSGKIRASKFDTAIRLWLSDYSKENRDAVLKALKAVPGAVQVFELDDGKSAYKMIHENFAGQTEKFKGWSLKHNPSLVNTVAAETGPDYVVALGENVGLSDAQGDHGGVQENVQRVPIIIYTPGAKAGSDPKELRHVDIKEIVMKTMF